MEGSLVAKHISTFTGRQRLARDLVFAKTEYLRYDNLSPTRDSVLSTAMGDWMKHEPTTMPVLRRYDGTPYHRVTIDHECWAGIICSSSGGVLITIYRSSLRL